MERIALSNRPTVVAPRTKIEDFLANGHHVRVCMTLREQTDVSNGAAEVVIDAQAFEVDDEGWNLPGPDGRPSRTPNSGHTIIATALGDTHTLAPGWVRAVGTYSPDTIDASVLQAQARPTGAPAEGAALEVYDAVASTLYRWDEGETIRIARGKVDEMLRLIANSSAVAGIEF